ncbi:hypothetical protein B0H14DRAFT_2388946, partial [Mycena olivaceomarginata]
QSNRLPLVSPALSVKGTPARSDVQRPSTAKPCGNIDPATTLDTSTATPVAADGLVTLDVTNFNAGADGSTSVAVSVDATGKGTSFVAGTVTTNGNPAPKAVETDKVTFTLPAGTKCTGGAAGNLCLVSVKTTAGFGACTVVSQGAAAPAAAAAATLPLLPPPPLPQSPRSPRTRRCARVRLARSAGSSSKPSRRLTRLSSAAGWRVGCELYDMLCTQGECAIANTNMND